MNRMSAPMGYNPTSMLPSAGGMIQPMSGGGGPPVGYVGNSLLPNVQGVNETGYHGGGDPPVGYVGNSLLPNVHGVSETGYRGGAYKAEKIAAMSAVSAKVARNFANSQPDPTPTVTPVQNASSQLASSQNASLEPTSLQNASSQLASSQNASLQNASLQNASSQTNAQPTIKSVSTSVPQSEQSSSNEPSDNMSGKEITLFGRTLRVRPSKEITTFTADENDALGLLGLEEARPDLKKEIIQAFYDGTCDTNLPISLLLECEPIRRVIHSLMEKLLQNVTKITPNAPPTLTNVIQTEKQSATLMTFNVYMHKCKKGGNSPLSFINNSGYDIICTQEDSVPKDTTLYKMVGYIGGRPSETEGVYVKKTDTPYPAIRPIFGDDEKVFTIGKEKITVPKRSASLFSYHGINIANLHLEGGRFSDRVLLHPDKAVRDEMLERKIKVVRLAIDENPDIILGDFNSVYDQSGNYNNINYAYYKNLKKADLTDDEKESIKKWSKDVFDLLKQKGYEYSEPNGDVTYTNARGNNIIDMIWYKKNSTTFTLENTKILDKTVPGETYDTDCSFSDHNPVVTMIRFTNTIQALAQTSNQLSTDAAAAALAAAKPLANSEEEAKAKGLSADASATAAATGADVTTDAEVPVTADAAIDLATGAASSTALETEEVPVTSDAAIDLATNTATAPAAETSNNTDDNILPILQAGITAVAANSLADTEEEIPTATVPAPTASLLVAKVPVAETSNNADDIILPILQAGITAVAAISSLYPSPSVQPSPSLLSSPNVQLSSSVQSSPNVQLSSSVQSSPSLVSGNELLKEVGMAAVSSLGYRDRSQSNEAVYANSEHAAIGAAAVYDVLQNGTIPSALIQSSPPLTTPKMRLETMPTSPSFDQGSLYAGIGAAAVYDVLQHEPIVLNSSSEIAAVSPSSTTAPASLQQSVVLPPASSILPPLRSRQPLSPELKQVVTNQRAALAQKLGMNARAANKAVSQGLITYEDVEPVVSAPLPTTISPLYGDEEKYVEAPIQSNTVQNVIERATQQSIASMKKRGNTLEAYENELRELEQTRKRLSNEILTKQANRATKNKSHDVQQAVIGMKGERERINARMRNLQKRINLKKGAQATQPVVDATQPVVDATQPVVQATQPVVDAMQPVVQAMQPMVQAMQPVVEATQPASGNKHLEIAKKQAVASGLSPRSFNKFSNAISSLQKSPTPELSPLQRYHTFTTLPELMKDYDKREKAKEKKHTELGIKAVKQYLNSMIKQINAIQDYSGKITGDKSSITGDLDTLSRLKNHLSMLIDDNDFTKIYSLHTNELKRMIATSELTDLQTKVLTELQRLSRLQGGGRKRKTYKKRISKRRVTQKK